MGVSDFLQDFNLPSDSLHVLLVVDLLLLQNFNCHLQAINPKTYLLSSQDMRSQFYLTKCSLTKSLALKRLKKLCLSYLECSGL